jgi:KipI family sensor histidine kinase inhibitor
VKLLRYGDTAWLAELDGLEATLALHAALLADPAGRPEGLLDLVPAETTVLVRCDPAHPDRAGRLAAARRWLEAAARSPAPAPAPGSRELVLRIHYDGTDLAEAGRLTGLGPDGLVEAHRAARWRVAFTGFAPGFGYLVGDDERLQVPRRDRPRPRVPAGSVALGGRYCGVYPRESPGGWQLIGRTETPVWDAGRDPPALLVPGTVVRFEPAPGGPP